MNSWIHDSYRMQCPLYYNIKIITINWQKKALTGMFSSSENVRKISQYDGNVKFRINRLNSNFAYSGKYACKVAAF